MSDAYKTFQAAIVRRPDDVPSVTPLSWLAEKEGRHAEHLSNRLLPADFPHPVRRGDAGDALAVLALREAIRRETEIGRGGRLCAALELGASWTEAAAALDISPAQARTVLREWTEGQHRLYQDYVARGHKPFGHSPERHAAVLALCAQDDEEASR